jgi:hypothetical protein
MSAHLAPRIGSSSCASLDNESKENQMDVVTELVEPLAAKLWSIYSNEHDGPHLIFPSYRTDAARISEQESKIMLCQVLEASPWFYSIETPTRETYVQSGLTPLSARTDVTVYGTKSAADRVLNIELKQGLPPVEHFRKDFEKLLRERVDGLWFHTLERAGAGTIPALLARMKTGIELVAEHAILVEHTITIAVCLLDRRVMLTVRLELQGDLEEQLERIFTADAEAWQIAGPGLAQYQTSKDRQLRAQLAPSARTRSKMLIYCPELADDTLLHFSSLGESYMLRAYAGRLAGRAAWAQPDTPTTTEFLARYSPTRQVELPPGHPSVDQVVEWEAIIARENERLGI